MYLIWATAEHRRELKSELLQIHISGQHLIFFKIENCGYNSTVLSDFKAGYEYHDRSSNSLIKQTSP